MLIVGISSNSSTEQPMAYLILVILVQVDATRLGLSPVLGYALVDVCLVYYLRYQLR